MNAGQEYTVRACVEIYDTISGIMNDDYDAWCRMSEETLFGEVMKRTQGHCNPIHVRAIINNL